MHRGVGSCCVRSHRRRALEERREEIALGKRRLLTRLGQHVGLSTEVRAVEGRVQFVAKVGRHAGELFDRRRAGHLGVPKDVIECGHRLLRRVLLAAGDDRGRQGEQEGGAKASGRGEQAILQKYRGDR